MQDLSQAVVELSCFTDDACGSVHNTLQGVSGRLRGSGQRGVALVHSGGHECVTSVAADSESSDRRTRLS